MCPRAPVHIAKLLLQDLFMDPMTSTPNGAGNRSLTSALYVLYFRPLPCCQALKIARAILITYQRRLSVSLCPDAASFVNPCSGRVDVPERVHIQYAEGEYVFLHLYCWLAALERAANAFFQGASSSENTQHPAESRFACAAEVESKRSPGKRWIFWALALTIDVKLLARFQYEHSVFAKTFCKALLDDK